ncbi:neural cell adhesion molecule L1 isoform X1 [Ranitomeya imitator]|uniref:neural cell adhesion molecule L1 isoform X1 n=1 Tax=Ranitomeya imitator TaxID=111125 RepID=UPI0037E9031C
MISLCSSLLLSNPQLQSCCSPRLYSKGKHTQSEEGRHTPLTSLLFLLRPGGRVYINHPERGAPAMSPAARVLGTLLLTLLCSRSQALDLPKDSQLFPPSFIEQPPKLYVMDPSDIITLKCEAKENSRATYMWEKDGVPFETNDTRVFLKKHSGTMIISPSNGNMRDFQGIYRCFASNELGTAVSNEMRVITEATPKWQKDNIQPVEAEEGDSVELPCNPPKSAVPPRIFWMNRALLHIIQDSRVSMGMNGNLYISNVKETDQHPDYMCHVQFVGTRTIMQKEPIELKVSRSNSVKFRKPRMMMPSGSISHHLALRGDPLQLECISEGLPTPENRWIANTGNTGLERFRVDDFKKTLYIESVLEEDDGEYECISNNTEGEVRHKYIVRVESAPFWINRPKDEIRGPGEHVKFTCEVEGKPKPKVSWKINGEPLTAADLGPNRKMEGGNLILQNLKTSDTAVVQCEARNKHGHILENAYIYVVELAPVILTPDRMNYSSVENTNVFLHCKFFGSPTPVTHWYDRDMRSVVMRDSFNILTNGSMEISDVTSEDEGLYYCTASNSQGNMTISAYLDVRNATQIITPPETQRVRKGGKATFECIPVFDPRMENKGVEWKKDGMDIIEDAADDKYYIEDYSLSIANVQEDDQGVYTCVARSELDAVEKTAVLVMIDLPEPAYDLELSDRQDTSVVLTWTPGEDNNSPIDEFIIEFEEDNFEPGIWHELTRVDGDENRARLNLSPYVNYQFRVIAVNELGPSNGSTSSDRVKTPEAAPTRNPVDVRGEGTEPHNMRITWKPMKGIDWNGPGFAYIVKWRRQNQNEHWNVKTVTENFLFVEDTNTFVPYDIKVQSVNDLGEGPEPKLITGYSGEDLPTIIPENIGLEAINDSTIKVAWLPVQKEGLNGRLKGFLIRYVAQNERHKNKLTVHGNVTHTSIYGLKPFTNYSVTVHVLNGKGEGIGSEMQTIRTEEGVPSPPTALRVERLSDSSLALYWGPPEHPNGIITGYKISHHLVSKDHADSFLLQTINDPAQQNWTFHNMSTKDTYKFYVYVKNSARESLPAEIEGSTMKELEFPPVLNISVSRTSKCITIKWRPLDGQRNVELKVQMKNKSSSSWQQYDVNASEAEFKIVELQPGENYFVRLLALNHSHYEEIWGVETLTLPSALPDEKGFASQGWFIGLISAIVLLLLILLILCFIKRSKGGKYSVKDKEDTQVDSEARPMKDETFGEYSDNDEKPFNSSQPSLNGDVKPLGSDDSLADYGGSVDVQFNEDGSFIGQYSGKKEKEAPGGNDSSGATSPVVPNIAIE